MNHELDQHAAEARGTSRKGRSVSEVLSRVAEVTYGSSVRRSSKPAFDVHGHDGV